MAATSRGFVELSEEKLTEKGKLMKHNGADKLFVQRKTFSLKCIILYLMKLNHSNMCYFLSLTLLI